MIGRHILMGVVLMGGSALCACSSTPTRFYTLDARPAQSTWATYDGPAFRIDAVHIPPALDRPELVNEISAERLIIHDQDHWAAPLGELFRRALTQDLSSRMPVGKIIFPETPKSPGSGGVVVDILAISPTPEGLAMDVSWTVVASSPSSAASPEPAVRRRTIRLLSNAQASGISATPAQFSALTDALADAIVLDWQSSAPTSGPKQTAARRRPD